MQCRCVGHAIVIGAGLHHHQHGGGLGKVAVQQVVEFLARVHPGQDRSPQPDGGDQPEQRQQQARLQGFKAAQLHAGVCFRSKV